MKGLGGVVLHVNSPKRDVCNGSQFLIGNQRYNKDLKPINVSVDKKG